MNSFDGIFFRNGSSESSQAIVNWEADGHLSIQLDETKIEFSKSEYTIEPKLGTTPRVIRFANGDLLESLAFDSILDLEQQTERNKGMRFVSVIEEKWKTVAASIVAVIAFSYVFLAYGIPILAEVAAVSTPQSIRTALTDQSIKAMESAKMLTPTELDEERQVKYTDLFEESLETSLQGGHDIFEYKLLFFKSKSIGANAFAFPSGSIVVTDEFVDLCGDEAEFKAVMLHEIAHVEKHHGIRSMLQDAGIYILASVLLGDVTSVSSLAGALPTLLVESHYSQKFEIEADRYSAEISIANGESTEGLKSALIRLQDGHQSSQLEDFLSTHPSLKQRLENLEAIQKSHSDFSQ